MPVIYCSVGICLTRRGDGLTFFRCPKDEARCQIWRTQLGFTGEHIFSNITPEQCYKRIKICSLHFTDESFTTPSKQRLNYNAIPTLFLSSATTNAENNSGAAASKVLRTELRDASIQTDSCIQANGTTQTRADIKIDQCCQTSKKISAVTPRKVALKLRMNTIKKEASQIRKRLEVGITLDDVGKFLEDNYPAKSCAFLKNQLSLLNKAPKGCRYTDEFKQFSLSVYFLGPKAYKKLSTVCRLPSKSTLQRFSKHWVINPGFNDFIFRLTELRVRLLQDKAKDCILCLDEISIKSHLFYDISKDKVIGFQEGINKKSADIASNALVLMARGIASSWKQPIAYFFYKTSPKSDELKDILFQSIRKLNTTGLNVLGVVSDQGSNFYQLVKTTLELTEDNPCFSVDEKRLIYMFDSGMVLGCKTLWTALQILWSTIYVVCGAFQLMAAIFFLISVSELTLYGVLFAGSWNIIIGIAGGMVACIGVLSPKRQEVLLYLAVTILAVNAVTGVMTEWKLYFIDMPKLYNRYSNHVLIDYALFVVRIAVTTVLVGSFLDSQFAFCSVHSLPKRSTKKRAHGSHDQVSDIEYIIPRSKSTKSAQPHQVYNAYAQSWVFDAENPGCSNGSTSATEPYHKIIQNGTPKNPLGRPNGLQNGSTVKEVTHLIDNPVVHVEEASDDSTSNSDRKLCHMKSFSRSASPVILSASSSQLSLNNYNPVPTNPPIYEYLEKLTEPQIYRSRLNTAVSNKSQEEELSQYQAPQTVMMRRVETVSPQVVEPVQYASLMKELQRAIVNKKEPPSVTSPLSNSESQSQSHSKSSDTEFSKELEAALQLIQDLESPNTAETPSDPPNPRPLAVWRKNSEPSGSEKTLSAVGSMAEITSPLAEMVVSQDHSPSSTGKGARVIVRYPDSQSTSGYSSPSHGPTPNWSTTSSINGSNNDIVKPVSYHIHNAKQTTVISLYSQATDNAKGKSVTLVKITGDSDPFEHSKTIDETPIHSSTLISDSNPPQSFIYTKNLSARLAPTQLELKTNTILQSPPKTTESNAGGIWNVKSLLRKKKNSTFPRLCPELEGAIIKSESLAYLSEVELLARARRNEEIQREIEERVIQQLGVPRTESESNC